jgi:hypothetical protein
MRSTPSQCILDDQSLRKKNDRTQPCPNCNETICETVAGPRNRSLAIGLGCLQGKSPKIPGSPEAVGWLCSHCFPSGFGYILKPPLVKHGQTQSLAGWVLFYLDFSRINHWNLGLLFLLTLFLWAKSRSQPCGPLHPLARCGNLTKRLPWESHIHWLIFNDPHEMALGYHVGYILFSERRISNRVTYGWFSNRVQLVT